MIIISNCYLCKVQTVLQMLWLSFTISFRLAIMKCPLFILLDAILPVPRAVTVRIAIMVYRCL